MDRFVKKIFKDVSSEKEIIIVSPREIRRRRVGVYGKILEFLFIGWVVFSTLFAFLNFKVIGGKNARINELKNINYDLSSNINGLNIIVDNMKSYLSSLNYYDRFNKIDIRKINDERNFVKNKELLSSMEYKKIMPIINIMDKNINTLGDSINARIDGINRVLGESATLKNKAHNVYRVKYGGNDDEIPGIQRIFSNTSVLMKNNDASSIEEKIKYLAFLEDFMNSAPISEPMKNYFLTSRYGSRIDPFTREVRPHKGLDFSGAYGSEIYSTADGVVEFVGVSGGFGNVVRVAHKNDIETAYAHLKEPLVEVGQKIARGNVIGIQGNSGRSTGHHLHYEVIVDKQNVDPMKFVTIGKLVY
jgi:murein DD-endopeptidase MepM/ murein hydrolase activator NlpD